jgi:hypothetical protein
MAMPKISVEPDVLIHLRFVLHEYALKNERAGFRSMKTHADVIRRVIKRINRALKQHYGHDCNAWCFLPTQEQPEPTPAPPGAKEE